MAWRLKSSVLTAVFMLGAAAGVSAQEYPQPLPVEATGDIKVLPAQYPKSWVFLHDAHFNSMVDGRIILVDSEAPADPVKGMIGAGQMGSFVAAKTRPELYVAETFYSRLAHGTRTDVISIWDKTSLAWKAEIELPGGKRGQTIPTGQNFQLLNNEKWGAVFNFTPAATVTIVDLEKRQVLSEIDIPGCSMIYPLGGAGFMTLCGDGTMASIPLDEQGKAGETVTSKPFNDIDGNPMFMTAAMAGNTAWFATFRGDIRGIDLSGPVARDLGSFALPQEKSEKGEWRPGGWQVITADDAGMLYVLMNPAGKEGSHKDGGSEVWVVDPVKKQRTARILLKEGAFSLQATQGAETRLAAALPDGSVDVYDAKSGAYLHRLPNVAHNIFAMAAAR